MSKSTGLGDRLAIDGIDISGDTNAISNISTPLATLDGTDITMSAKARLQGKGDGLLEWVSFFNPGVNSTHAKLLALPTADVILTYQHGQTQGDAAASMVAKQINYDPTRANDGAFTFKVQAQANGSGLEWGDQLTVGFSTLGGAGALTGLDYGASLGTTAFGAQAFLQVKAPFTGTSATVAVQHSDDNGSVDPYANVAGLVFTAATGPTAQRVSTGRTASIKRWLRVNVTGTFTALTFAVQVAKNPVASVLP